MGERLERERAPRALVGAVAALERRQDVVVAGGRGHDRDIGVVLRRRPDHRRSADVDLLDQLVDRDAGALERRRERVQVDDHELERGDRRLHELPPVVLAPPIGQEARVDPGMQRLDPPIEHLQGAGPGGPTGRHQLEAVRDEAAPEVDQPGLVRHGQQRPPRERDARLGASRVHPDPAFVDPDRAGGQQRDGPRQQPVLDRVDPRREAVGVVAREHRDRLLEQDRTAVERLVDEVDRHAGHGHAAG